MNYTEAVNRVVDALLTEMVRVNIGVPVSRDLKTGLRYREPMKELRYQTGIDDLTVEPVPHGRSFAGYAPEKERVTKGLVTATGLSPEKVSRETGAVRVIGLEPAHPAYGGVRAQRGVFAHEAGHFLHKHNETDAQHATGQEEVDREAEAWDAGEAFAQHTGMDADFVHRTPALNSYREYNGIRPEPETPEETATWTARDKVKQNSDEDSDTLFYGAKQVRRTQGIQRERITRFAAKHGVDNPLY
jgi:hypothetical protein